ncbi:MAG: periplasmic binding protein/LacI transcriptional regulator [Herbinix sp.]|jgi:D-xylose transport system substrate-binding protein|nr:periplasmic binding protein/LacI transcriptional regulator [Herbinix sp.]
MKKISAILAMLLILIFTLTGCSDGNEDTKDTDVIEKKIQIGLSFDSFVIERWQRDREVFVSTAQDLGAEVNVQNANGDVEEQISQIDYFIDKKMDVIVVIAVDSEACSDVLKKAEEAGIIVVAYDRLVRNANADLYISFDNEEVGRLMAETLTSEVPKDGNIVTIFGPTTDHNVTLVEQGFKDVMEDSDLNIVYTVYAKEWLAEEAFNAVNAALEITPEIDGVLCGNDNLASQAVRALSESRLAGKVVVTGQDADLVACQRIVEGTQTMTVYKPVDKLAKAAAEYAVKLAKGEDIGVETTINDGNYEVPYVKLEPIAVTKDNIKEVIIEGGFQQEDEVYLNVSDKQEINDTEDD